MTAVAIVNPNIGLVNRLVFVGIIEKQQIQRTRLGLSIKLSLTAEGRNGKTSHVKTQRLLSTNCSEKILISFNGSGYADRTPAGRFMDGHLAYQHWKRREYGMTAADKFWGAGLTVAMTLIKTSDGPSQYPPTRSCSSSQSTTRPARRCCAHGAECFTS